MAIITIITIAIFTTVSLYLSLRSIISSSSFRDAPEKQEHSKLYPHANRVFNIAKNTCTATPTHTKQKTAI